MRYDILPYKTNCLKLVLYKKRSPKSLDLEDLK